MLFHTILIDTNTFFFKDNIVNGQLVIPPGLMWLIEKVQKENQREKLEIEIPEIVFLEYKRHILEEVQDKIQKMESLVYTGSLPGFEVRKVHNEMSVGEFVEDITTKLKEKLISENNVGFNVPISNISLKSVVERSVSKSAPFEGREKSSDKGFKDTILWESLISFKRKHRMNTVSLYTKDKRFSEDLELEYEALFGEKITILKAEEDVLKLIEAVYKEENPEIEQEIKDVQSLRKYITLNEELIKGVILDSFEQGNWLGTGMSMRNLYTIKVEAILPSKYSSYHVKGDYYVQIGIESEIEQEDFTQQFNTLLHFDVSLGEENEYKFVLTGFGGF